MMWDHPLGREQRAGHSDLSREQLREAVEDLPQFKGSKKRLVKVVEGSGLRNNSGIKHQEP